MTTIRDGLRIEKLGGRNWIVRNDCGDYLGVVCEFSIGCEPYYCASVDRFPEGKAEGSQLPRYVSLSDAIDRFAF